ncbi:hypothetical protein BGZ61DRAFT_44940 [Ilyonectria robusta]|uniref:uncharacterized protein n=1 Tax=Ilyonectria robusta TaxID=1079257 RepID=UPI001E8D1AFD|nr:uncharacterized protein BGZ61DRAFT_44940 [Ilyonectria robusta]KAH8686735.1 hypothetical protein BGZ61DRAFT_44940 [Ilyonectria robusta]
MPVPSYPVISCPFTPLSALPCACVLCTAGNPHQLRASSRVVFSSQPITQKLRHGRRPTLGCEGFRSGPRTVVHVELISTKEPEA